MTIFAHTYKSHDEVAADMSVDLAGAKYALVYHHEDGSVETVTSDEMPALKDKNVAITKALFAVKGGNDTCDLYNYGDFYGTAEYAKVNPDSWFSTVVFSTAY
jgi:hypothetical protein